MKNIVEISVNTTSVNCAGREVPYDHPKIYLEIPFSQGFIICPYCSNKFILNLTT